MTSSESEIFHASNAIYINISLKKFTGWNRVKQRRSTTITISATKKITIVPEVLEVIRDRRRFVAMLEATATRVCAADSARARQSNVFMSILEFIIYYFVNQQYHISSFYLGHQHSIQ